MLAKGFDVGNTHVDDALRMQFSPNEYRMMLHFAEAAGFPDLLPYIHTRLIGAEDNALPDWCDAAAVQFRQTVAGPLWAHGRRWNESHQSQVNGLQRAFTAAYAVPVAGGGAYHAVEVPFAQDQIDWLIGRGIRHMRLGPEDYPRQKRWGNHLPLGRELDDESRYAYIMQKRVHIAGWRAQWALAQRAQMAREGQTQPFGGNRARGDAWGRV